MILSNELAGIRRVFIDTAPIIYYIEAHSQFGPVTKEIFQTFHSGKSMAFTSVITINDTKLKQIKDIRVLVLKDYI